MDAKVLDILFHQLFIPQNRVQQQHLFNERHPNSNHLFTRAKWTFADKFSDDRDGDEIRGKMSCDRIGHTVRKREEYNT